MVIVLIFNFVRLLFSSGESADAGVHIVSGDVQLKVWGTEEFFALRSDTVVMPGDQITTAGGGKLIVEFFDGTLARLGEETELTFEVMEDGDEPVIELTLHKGDLWINRVYKNTAATEVKVKMDNVGVVAADASVFALENSRRGEAVRVLNSFDDRAGATIEVYDKKGEEVIETEEVSIAQEAVFNSQVLARYWEFKSPTVIAGLTADFTDSDWYKWNLQEDQDPTRFEVSSGGTENVGLVPVEEEIKSEEEEVEEVEEVEEGQDEEDVEEVSGSLAAPKLTSVSGGAANAEGVYTVTNNPAVISGTVSGASQVVVNGYALQKFTPGSGAWTYYANADFGLMKEGENNFEVYGVDSAGKKSSLLNFKVVYQPKVVEPTPEPLVEEENSEVEN